MELLSPAGNLEKLKYAYQYGADAAYIGIGNFSLRTRADNFRDNEHERIASVKGNKKLYCALNIYFHNDDIRRLKEDLPYFTLYPFDAFIISDPGIIPIIRESFPGAELHLSTQANCLNAEAVKFYRDIGFSRVILGRETSLKDIEAIKKAVPDVELETFVHGAMCMAYSGRCYLSAWMTGRSANEGHCSHSCRWDYRLHLEEKERPGEYMPVAEGDGFTSILSSKDICLIDHLEDLKNAGIDSLKIEGRMKSLYYAAVVTRAYRKALDKLEGRYDGDVDGYRQDLFRVSHREYSTGFYFGKQDIEKPTEKSYERQYIFLGTLGEEVTPGEWTLIPKNKIKRSDTLEFIGPDILYLESTEFTILDSEGDEVFEADHGKRYTLKCAADLSEGFIVRKKRRSSLNINEIASRAEVSIATVSRVLNNKPDVNTKTREKVLAIIRDSGYKKKILPRNQPFIGVVGSFRGREQDHYFSRILAGIEQALWQFGGMPLIITQAALYRMINENGEKNLAERLDGLIWISRTPDRDLLDSVKKSGIPMAMINHDMKNISHVSSNRLKAMSDAVQYLSRNGHSLISYLGNENMRLADTFRKSMRENKLTVFEEWLVCDPGEENREEGRSGTARIFGQQNRPTAMILGSDTMAPGVYEKLAELNLEIPLDVSLISFGDYPLADYLKPGLSTYRQPLFQMGEEAASAIITNLDSQNDTEVCLINKQLRMPFISRSSVKNLYH